MHAHPQNATLEAQNPDLRSPPPTDHGLLPNLKFSFSQAHNRVEHGGWAREVTARELPVATTLAGVNMRLDPGGVREMHWHKQAEWAYMLDGRARITGVDAEGRNFADDVGVGDLWYFPPGIPHSIQGLEEGAEFLLVFNDGNFSEGSTFLISDWLAHTPRGVVAQNFGVSVDDLANLPERERYIFQATMPGPLTSDQVQNPSGAVPSSFSYRLSRQVPTQAPGGTIRIADSTNFPVSEKIAAALVEVAPGGLRELHWHPTNDEWQYWIEGTGRMTVFGAEAKARTFDFQPGDVGYVPFAMGHYIQNTGPGTLRFLELFASPRYQDISLRQWMALTPPELVRDHLHLNSRMMAALEKRKLPIVP
ncbi:MAG: oxalate decarboxylase family bicupin [Acetobacteraceae bacterium]